MRARRYDLIVVLVVTAVAIMLGLVGVSHVVLGVLFGAPLVLFLPGYALTAAFTSGQLSAAERLLFSLGISLALTVIGGLLLSWTPWDLQRRSWTVLLGGVALVATVVALVRRSGLSESAPPAPIALSIRQGLLVGLAVLGVAMGVVLARIGATQQRTTPFTQLWLLPDAQAVDGRVRLGVQNMEDVATSYKLQLTDSDKLIREWPSIVLAPGKRWEATVDLPQARGARTPVKAMLFRLDTPGKVYRHTILWPEPANLRSRP